MIQKLEPLELAVVTCHEIGHVLGEVKVNGSGVEGEADFFAGSCFRKFMNRTSVSRLEEIAQETYQKVGNTNEIDPNLAKEVKAKGIDQNVHVGSTCPTLANDTNGDGYVDYFETIAVSGGILVPLDNDIESQRVGSFPRPTRSGTYTYSETASLRRIYSYVRSTDTNTDDEFVKIDASENRVFSNRVFVVYGETQQQNLQGYAPNAQDTTGLAIIPVACGVIPEQQEQLVPATSASPTPTPTPTPTATPEPDDEIVEPVDENTFDDSL